MAEGSFATVGDTPTAAAAPAGWGSGIAAAAAPLRREGRDACSAGSRLLRREGVDGGARRRLVLQQRRQEGRLLGSRLRSSTTPGKHPAPRHSASCSDKL